MKILVLYSGWVGGWMEYVARALEENGHEIYKLQYKRLKSPLRLFKIHNIVQIRNWLENKSWLAFNNDIRWKIDKIKPDLFLNMNECCLFPSTIAYAQKNNSKTFCFVADNPFDSHRYTYFPISLQYYDNILVSDRVWIQSIRNIAPRSNIIKIPSGGGYSRELFYPVDDKSIISEDDKKELSCAISFTGESYGIHGEGGYRAGILDQLGDYNVKIWGDERWKMRFPFYKNLRQFYQGGRLPFDKLRKLYHLSTINLNMPAPQVFTGFQPRVFEIAACKGFQIVDWREELDEHFSEDELVTFKNIPDLLDKIEFFLKNPEKRKPYIEKMYTKVISNYTWEQTISKILCSIQLN